MKENLITLITGISILFIIVLVNAVIWGCIGWFIGLFAGDAILGWFAGIGIKNITMFQLFAIFGVIKSLLFGGR